jgi:hypothetical protein
MKVSGRWGWDRKVVVLNGYKVSVCNDDKVLEMDSDDSPISL